MSLSLAATVVRDNSPLGDASEPYVPSKDR